MNSNTQLLTREDLAKMLKVSTQKIRRMEKEGLPVFFLGNNSPRYELQEVVKWIKEKNG